MICSTVNDNGILGTGYNNELHTRYDELDLAWSKIGRLRWLGQLCRMQELDPCRKLTVPTAKGTPRVGELKLMWLGQLRRI